MTDRVSWIQCLIIRDGVVDRNFELSATNTAFALEAKNGNAKFSLKIDLAQAEYAERHLQSFLTSWEADMLLQTSTSRRDFRIGQVQMQSGSFVAYGPEITVNIVGERAEANHLIHFPWLHHRYEKLPLVSALIQRYQSYRQGHELLPVVGYLCLSALEQAAGGGRQNFCRQFRVALPVRQRFGDLVSGVGTFATARKIQGNHKFRALLPAESYWLETTLRQILDRAGTLGVGKSLIDELTFDTLPPLASAPH